MGRWNRKGPCRKAEIVEIVRPVEDLDENESLSLAFCRARTVHAHDDGPSALEYIMKSGADGLGKIQSIDHICILVTHYAFANSSVTVDARVSHALVTPCAACNGRETESGRDESQIA